MTLILFTMGEAKYRTWFESVGMKYSFARWGSVMSDVGVWGLGGSCWGNLGFVHRFVSCRQYISIHVRSERDGALVAGIARITGMGRASKKCLRRFNLDLRNKAT